MATAVLGQMADALNRQLAETSALTITASSLERAFSVVLVDGPAGVLNSSPGRMAPIATAAALADHGRPTVTSLALSATTMVSPAVRIPGTSRTGAAVVFVDDTDRFVEQVFAAATLRPLFAHEVDCRASHRPLRFYTNDDWLPGRLLGRPGYPVMLDFTPIAEDEFQRKKH